MKCSKKIVTSTGQMLSKRQMRHWCHCFSSVSIFIVLCNPSRKLFLRCSMAGNSFGLFPSDRCLQMSETATRAERRLQNIPILMEAHDSRKQQEFRDFINLLQMELLSEAVVSILKADFAFFFLVIFIPLCGLFLLLW